MATGHDSSPVSRPSGFEAKQSPCNEKLLKVGIEKRQKCMLKYVEKKYQSSEHKLSFNRFISSPTLFENHSRWHLSRDIFQFPTRSLLRAYTFPPTWMHRKCR